MNAASSIDSSINSKGTLKCAALATNSNIMSGEGGIIAKARNLVNRTLLRKLGDDRIENMVEFAQKIWCCSHRKYGDVRTVKLIR